MLLDQLYLSPSWAMNQYRPFRDSAEMTSLPLVSVRRHGRDYTLFVKYRTLVYLFVEQTKGKVALIVDPMLTIRMYTQFVYKAKRYRLDYAYMKCHTLVSIRRTDQRKGCTHSLSQHADGKNVQFVYKAKIYGLESAYIKCRTVVRLYWEQAKGN